MKSLQKEDERYASVCKDLYLSLLTRDIHDYLKNMFVWGHGCFVFTLFYRKRTEKGTAFPSVFKDLYLSLLTFDILVYLRNMFVWGHACFVFTLFHNSEKRLIGRNLKKLNLSVNNVAF